MIRRKLVKILRAARWQHAPGDRVPMFWHVGRPNFGDDINPLFFERVTRRRMRLSRRQAERHILGMGSILRFANEHSVVIGSGLLEPSDEPVDPRATIVAVRGMLSLERIARPDGVLLGDPMVLARDLMTAMPQKTHRFGFVPHVRSRDHWQAACGGRHLVIDPGLDPMKVLRLIAGCEIIVSQSLHGLIVADAFGMPNVWVAPGEEMAGADFKFRDYFSTLDRDKPMIPLSDAIFDHPAVFDAEVANYRFPLDDYRAAIAGAVETHFPSAG